MFVLLTHGSSHANHALQVKELAEKVSVLVGETVGVSFLSDKALPPNAKVLPLFLGEGSHMLEDVPRMIKAADATLLATMADHADEIADMVVQQLTQDSKRIHVVFTMYQFKGFNKMLTAAYKKSKGCSLVAMATLHGCPTVKSVLRSLEQQGNKKLILQPFILFDGHSLDMCQAAADESTVDVQVNSALANLDGMSVWIAEQFKRA
ncbi:MAG: hypothetical protein R8M14_05030 [Ghiorsea sp.]